MSGYEESKVDDLDPADSFILQYFYKPKPSEILYHYCSMEAFEAIVRSGKIRMSDINMMNDFAELQWGYRIFEEAATTVLRDRENDPSLPDRSFFDEIDQYLSPANLYFHPLVACFSKSSDVLSQWRGYAGDATGVAIGFDATKLSCIAATFLNCEYDFDTQVQQMRARLLAAYSLGDEFTPSQHAFHTFGYLPSLKNPAFREEAEVRAIHLLNVNISDEGVQLTDPGGEAFGSSIDGSAVEFGIRQNGVVAYVDLPYFDQVPDGVISEVILGPKNPNTPTNISALLMRHGHKSVTIKCSNATYR